MNLLDLIKCLHQEIREIRSQITSIQVNPADLIDDAVTVLDKTWSSSKINAFVLSQVSTKADISYVDAQNVIVLSNAQSYIDGLISSLLDGVPAEGNTLNNLYHLIQDLSQVVDTNTQSVSDIQSDLSNYVTLNTAQTVSGVKTFLNGSFGLRNVANTNTSFFTTAATTSRTWTLPDSNGTLALLTDLPLNQVTRVIYIDGVNGSDFTGTVGSLSKPYRTLDAAISAIGSIGYWRLHIINSGTYLISNSYYNVANLTYSSALDNQMIEFYSEDAVTISFEGNTNGTIFGNALNGTNLFFNIPKGTLFLSNSTAVVVATRASTKIICKELDTGSFSTTNVPFSDVNNFHLEAEKVTLKRQYLARGLGGYIRDFYVRIYNLVANYSKCSLVTTSLGARVEILNTVSGTGSYIMATSKGYHSIKNYTATGGNLLITSQTYECVVEFLDSNISGSNIDLSEWNFGDVTLTGRILESSSATLKGTNVAAGTLRLTNFSHDFKTSTLYLYQLPKLILTNTFLKFTNAPFSRYNTQSTTVELRGTNTIYSNSSGVVFTTSNTAPITVNNYGVFKTNIASWGTLVTVNDLASNIIHGVGDMTTTTNQTVSGIKTFLDGKFGMRNVADTFTSYFTNSVTASRTWTLPDISGTLALESSLPLFDSYRVEAASAYTFTSGDEFTIIHPTGVSTYTIPHSSTYDFALGTQIKLSGAGFTLITVTQEAGVTVIANNGNTIRIAGTITLTKVGVNTWHLALDAFDFKLVGNNITTGNNITAAYVYGNSFIVGTNIGKDSDTYFNFSSKRITQKTFGTVNNTAAGLYGYIGTGLTFDPTSGTAEYASFYSNPIINQTGTANGISRGFYCIPTLTSATEFRALELVQGSIVLPHLRVSSSLTLSQSDYYIEVDTPGVTITLPTAVTKTGKHFNIKNNSGGTITIRTTSPDTIDGVNSFGLYSNNSMFVVSNGTNWLRIGTGDMTTNSPQDVTAVKTFLDGNLGLRNVANTFTSVFSNAATISRTWTLPDKSGVVAIDGDVLEQVSVGSNITIQESWRGKVVFFTANCTVTVPATLSDSFAFQGITLAGVTVTWAITTPKVWLFGTPAATTEKTTFSFIQQGATNNVIILG